MLSDSLKNKILEFRRLRDWEKFHAPKNLIMAISVEAAELLEPFRWANGSDDDRILKEKRQEICDEMADICILLTYLAHDLAIDIESAVEKKLQSNGAKYPAEKFRGSSKKYSDL